jgi:hypothetical protein
MTEKTVRLFEHIKLLQRGVEVAQEGKIAGVSAVSLPRGLNNEPVRIGLIGATSAGNTTLIPHLLRVSAGKISSKPETACLVIPSFSKSENIVLQLNDKVLLKDSKESSIFREFLRKYDLHNSYDHLDDSEWSANEKCVTKELSRERILDFFGLVNDFDKVFKSIKWNHKRRGDEYNLTDLIDIYDLPGFGGKEAHEEVVASVFGDADFDILIYLIDSSCGIPSAEEGGSLKGIESFLQAHPKCKMYWAYEKPLYGVEVIDREEAQERIQTALETMDIKIRADFLDLTGDVDDETDDVSERILSEVLRPYFVEAGKKYFKELFKRNEITDAEALSNVFEMETSCKDIERILGEIDTNSWNDSMTVGDAEEFILNKIGVDAEELKNITPKKPLKDALLSKIYAIGNLHRRHGNKISSKTEEEQIPDKDYARLKVGCRILSTVRKLLEEMVDKTDRNRISINRVRDLRKSYSQNPDFRILVYDIQFYLMLKNYESVRACILMPMVDSLRDNIKQEVQALEDFDIDD